MRPCLSSLLLVLICTGVLQPLLHASSTDLPACCRRGSNHHCMRSTGADGIRSAAMVCPYRSLRVLTTRAAALVTIRTVAPGSEPQDTIQTSSLPLLAFPVSEGCRPRGPPLS